MAQFLRDIHGFSTKWRWTQKCAGMNFVKLCLHHFQLNHLEGTKIQFIFSQKYVETKALPQQWEHEAHEFTDQKPEQLILDSVRARLLDFLQNEIPYKLKCELEFFDIYEGKSTPMPHLPKKTILTHFYFRQNNCIGQCCLSKSTH